jgi:hypothetical protein
MNNLQRGKGWEQNCAYVLLHGGREGTLQCAAQTELDTCQ